MIPELHPTARDVVEAVAILCIVLATLFKLWSLYRHTVKWNGLGRALRDEKWSYVVVWSWILLKGTFDFLDHSIILIAIAVFVVTAEIRVARYVPRVTIKHHH